MTDEALKKLDECFDELLAEENARAAAGKRATSVTAIDYTGITSKRGTVALKTADQNSGGQMADRVKELSDLKAQLTSAFDDAMKTLDTKLAAAKAESETAEKAVIRDVAEKHGTAAGILLCRQNPQAGGPPK